MTIKFVIHYFLQILKLVFVSFVTRMLFWDSPCYISKYSHFDEEICK